MNNVNDGKQKRCLVIIAAYNEEESISNVVDNLIHNYPQYDYVVIDDGSQDNTRKKCEDHQYNYLSLPINLGIGGAIQTGYIYARDYGYDIAVQLDGDGQHDPSYIADIITPIVNEECNYVIGSRFLDKQGFQSSGLRRFGIRFLSDLIHVLSGKKIYDVTSGFRAIDRTYIEHFAISYPTDYPEPEAIIDAVMNRAKIIEVPVVMRERENGKSSINLRRSIYYMIKVTLDIIVCRISFGVRREKR